MRTAELSVLVKRTWWPDMKTLGSCFGSGGLTGQIGSASEEGADGDVAPSAVGGQGDGWRCGQGVGEAGHPLDVR